ncbi:CRP/FNR family transcriptional regulator [Lutibacter oceani]|uniref:CRP/FNR family transcriptional regulator n=1 Tax=Lutibacter oceani TaxID=1853311 RepID=A0A3D9S440_9FLAO|nr:Crp/Fnr family transcriptional regulator [Lutibacter oceani]REE83342.1 CRP/FNR family transcriptional regulator [Lutibacter oceani]
MKINEIVDNCFSDIFEKQLQNELCKYAILKHAEPDKIILEIRREIKFIPIIISGVAKVMRRDGKGNGIFLHYLSNNQTSSIAISYALENKNSQIRIKAESNITYIAIPVKIVNSWFEKYSSWRSYFLKQNQTQTYFLLEVINDIAFENLEFRVLKYIEHTSLIYKENTINKKHFDLARDLKVSREAISRVLKKLEKEDIVTLGRNKITLN